MAGSEILILRIGLGLVFILLGWSILKEPMRFGKLVKPWAAKLVPVPMETAMMLTGVYDVINGLWLLTGWLLWLSALIAALHLIQVLLTTGGTKGTLRDIGLLAMAVVLSMHNWPFR